MLRQRRLDPGPLALLTVLLVMPWTPVHGSEGSDDKAALADQIMAREEARSGRPWDPSAKASLRQALLARSVADLEAAAAGERPLGRLMNADAFGGNVDDLVFTPVPACRVLDTRPGSGVSGAGTGPVGPGVPRSMFAAGICSVPFPSAKAVVANFMAVDVGGPGDLRVWPWDESAPPQPATPMLAYTTYSPVVNGITMPICNTATATSGKCTKDLWFQTNGSATQVVVTVLGYFAAPRATSLDCVDVLEDWYLENDAVVSLPASCPAGYSITGSGFSHPGIIGADASLLLINFGSYPESNNTRCEIYNRTGSPYTVWCAARCCRIPGR